MIEDENTDVRWLQKLDSFSRAYKSFMKAVNRYKDEDGFDDELLQDGLIQRYEVVFEQGWSTLKKYIQHNKLAGHNKLKAAESVFTLACTLNLLENLEAWIEALEARNQTSHQYDGEMAEELAAYIVEEAEVLISILIKKLYEWKGDKKLPSELL